MTAKYRKGFVQRGSVEREEYAKVPSTSPAEGKAEAERTDQQEPRQKCAHGDGKGEGVHPRLDWILLHCRYETHPSTLE